MNAVFLNVKHSVPELSIGIAAGTRRNSGNFPLPAERISQNNSEKFRFPFHGFQAEQTVTRLDDNRYRLTYSLTSSGNIETNSIYFLMTPSLGLAEHNEVRLEWPGNSVSLVV